MKVALDAVIPLVNAADDAEIPAVKAPDEALIPFVNVALEPLTALVRASLAPVMLEVAAIVFAAQVFVIVPLLPVMFPDDTNTPAASVLVIAADEALIALVTDTPAENAPLDAVMPLVKAADDALMPFVNAALDPLTALVKANRAPVMLEVAAIVFAAHVLVIVPLLPVMLPDETRTPAASVFVIAALDALMALVTETPALNAPLDALIPFVKAPEDAVMPLVIAALDAVIPPLNDPVVAFIPLVRAICTPVKLLEASSAVKFPLDALVAPIGVPAM